MSVPAQNSIVRSFAIAAGLAAAALAAPAGAVPVSVTYSATGLPAVGGAISNLDLTGSVGKTSFTTGTGANAVSVATSGSGAVVQGSSTNNYAAPVTGGTVANPTYYTSPYLSTGGTSGVITLTFSSAQSFLGLLWGSIGSGDTLSFYDASNTLLNTVTGATAAATAPGYNPAMGAQGYGGSQYTLINFFGSQFTKVVLSQSVAASFEAAGFEYSAQNVPEPTSIALAGLALVSCIAFRRKA